jgi:hypothetical protein
LIGDIRPVSWRHVDIIPPFINAATVSQSAVFGYHRRRKCAASGECGSIGALAQSGEDALGREEQGLAVF